MWETDTPSEEDIKPDFSAFLDVNASQEVRDGKVPYLSQSSEQFPENITFFVKEILKELSTRWRTRKIARLHEAFRLFYRLDKCFFCYFFHP